MNSEDMTIPDGTEEYGTAVTYWDSEARPHRALILDCRWTEIGRGKSLQFTFHVQGHGMTAGHAHVLTLGWHSEI
jgi:hypothetical protein